MESIQTFVWYILDLVELSPISDLLVGNNATGGLSFEQKKRLSIAVELVANPSVIFLVSVFGFREGYGLDSDVSTVRGFLRRSRPYDLSLSVSLTNFCIDRHRMSRLVDLMLGTPKVL
jgi:hypothetical protein